MRWSLLLLAFLLAASDTFSQNVMLLGLSPSYSQTGKLVGKVGYNLNATSAISLMGQTIEKKYFPAGHTHLVATGLLTYQASHQVTIAGGYAFGRHNIFGIRENEHRFLAQVSYQHRARDLIVTHRGRFELRYPLNLQTNTYSEADIFRYQIWVTYPLYDPAKEKKGFYLAASNEAFLYFKGATNGPVSAKNGTILSENWMHVGGGYNTGRTRFEAGYCYQSLIRNNKQEYRFFNLLQLNIYHTINWKEVQSWWYL